MFEEDAMDSVPLPLRRISFECSTLSQDAERVPFAQITGNV